MESLRSFRRRLGSSRRLAPLKNAYDQVRSVLLTLGAFLPPKFEDKLVGPAPELAPDIKLLVATSVGLFQITDQQIRMLLRGEFYGITEHRDAWIAFEKCGRLGRLLSLFYPPSSSEDPKRRGWISVSLKGLSRGVHQIDSIGDRLLLADTYNNRVLVASPVESGSRAFRIIDRIYPAGPLRQEGRKSENYVHLNSLFQNGDELFILFHNETKKTGKRSEICTYDLRRGMVRERRVLDAGAGHNVVPWKGELLCCDSLGGRLMLGNTPVFSADSFLRGLAVTEDLILVGGSELAGRRDRRIGTGVIFILNHGFDLLDKLELPGAVHEIRHQSGNDYGMSSFAPD